MRPEMGKDVVGSSGEPVMFASASDVTTEVY